MISSSFATSKPTDAVLALHRCGHGDHRGVLVVVTGAEGIVDVDVAERRDLSGESGSPSCSPGSKRQVFEHAARIAGLHACDAAATDGPIDDIRGLADRSAEQLAEAPGDAIHLERSVLAGSPMDGRGGSCR